MVVTGDGEAPLACVDSLEKMRLTGDRIVVLGYQKSCHKEEERIVSGRVERPELQRKNPDA